MYLRDCASLSAAAFMSVSMMPGATALTVMPRGPSSLANLDREHAIELLFRGLREALDEPDPSVVHEDVEAGNIDSPERDVDLLA